MFEAQKTNSTRNSKFFQTYFSGKIIDIGAGPDLIHCSAERFDIEDGDANFILNYRSAESYDTVHSSHCLEHMIDPERTLTEWWSLIKPGGHLVLVVPDEDLYEQGFWPSRFNGDHKVTFTTKIKKINWSPVSYNISNMVQKLPGVKVISIDIQDHFYDYTLQSKHPHKIQKVPSWISKILTLCNNLPNSKIKLRAIRHLEDLCFRNYGVPIDQTMREALAQIQIVAQKI